MVSFGLAQAMKFSSVAVVVKDAKKSAQWYKEKLGLGIRSKAGHWITVAPKDSSVKIHLCEEFYPLEPGNTGFAFVSEDVAKDQKQLESRGVKFTTPTTKEDWGTYAMFADPDGNEFWIVQD